MPSKDPAIRKATDRRSYERNRDTKLPRERERSAHKRALIRSVIDLALIGGECVDCGENDPVVLDFDHIGDKRFNISDAVARLTPVPQLIVELGKCELRCANCHRRKTHRTHGHRPKAVEDESAVANGDAPKEDL